MSASCKSAPQRLAEQVENGASWTATAGMAASAWTRNSVPARYAERAAEEAHSNLHRAVQAAGGLDAEGRDDAVRALTAAEQSVVRLADAVRRRNPGDARARLPEVDGAREELSRLHDRLERAP